MSAPSPVVRAVVYERDGGQCIRCRTTQTLTFQHRQATGMGGSKVKPGYADGLTACLICNAGFEGEGQQEAFRNGWKVPRWAKFPQLVPVFYPRFHQWFLLCQDGTRTPIQEATALDLMRLQYGAETVDAARP